VLALLTAVTVLPVFTARQLAEARRFSTARWSVVASVAVLLGLGGAYRLHQHHGTSTLMAALPLLLTWAGPAGLWLLEEGQSRVGGRAGRHE
jgi:ABC-type transport system involved in cytochrome c biogenesis permease component